MAAPLALAGGAIAKKYLAGKGAGALTQRIGGQAATMGVQKMMDRKPGLKGPGGMF